MSKSYAKVRYQRLPAQQSIRIFEAAARHLNFTLAAEELAITQSAVSKQIKGLETFLGVTLFVRKGQSIDLTGAGFLFYQRCEQALNFLQLAVDEAQGESGSLKLQVPPTFAMRWLIPNMEQLKRSHPKLDVQLETTWLRTAKDKVKPDLNELVIHACMGYSYTDVSVDPLFQEELYVLASPDFIEKHGAISSPLDLVGKKLIHTRLDGKIHWELFTEQYDLPEILNNEGYEFETLDMALAAAENGMGVIVCDIFYAMDSIEKGRLVIPFNMSAILGFKYVFIRNSNSNYISLQKNFCKTLSKLVGEHKEGIRKKLAQLN